MFIKWVSVQRCSGYKFHIVNLPSGVLSVQYLEIKQHNAPTAIARFGSFFIWGLIFPLLFSLSLSQIPRVKPCRYIATIADCVNETRELLLFIRLVRAIHV